MKSLTPRRIFIAGGFISSVVLIGFGIAIIAAGFIGIDFVRDSLAEENIVGPEDSEIPGELVDTGSEALKMAEIMREHTLERTGATYSELPRYLDENDQPTNDINAAAIGDDGQPIPNPQRTLWVTETALTTALNMAYFGEQIGNFAIVVGVALVLTGIGFVVLTVGALLLPSLKTAPAA